MSRRRRRSDDDDDDEDEAASSSQQHSRSSYLNIPQALGPLARRLRSIPSLGPDERLAVLFLVRLGDELHRAFYATFLTRSLIHGLRDELGVPDLDAEIEVYRIRWTFRQGLVSVTHNVAWDYDMYAVNVLTKIGTGVSNGDITAREGLRLIRQFEKDPPFSRWGAWYRNFPGRMLVIPLMASTCATVYFEGTWYDLGFAALNGTVAAILAWLSTYATDLMNIADYAVSVAVAMLSVMSFTVYPQGACFGAQVLGTLYWFLYGTAFVLSIYELTNNQLVTGLSRFVAATLRSYGLAIGTVLGVWIAAYGGENRWNEITAPCHTKEEGQIDDIWFVLLFPLSGVACLMQFRVGLRHYPVCLFVQTVAYGLQYWLGTYLRQPDFVANLVPAYAATLASWMCVEAVHAIQVRRYGPRPTEAQRQKSVFLPSFGRLDSAKRKDDDDDGAPKLSLRGEDVEQAVEVDGSSPTRRNIDTEAATDAGEQDESLQIAYEDEGWAENSRGVRAKTGYIHTDTLSYQRTDLWFCLLPALYLLVPGSKLLQTAFYDLMGALGTPEGETTGTDSLGSFATSLLIIALGQVVGLRAGFATLWIVDEVWGRIKDDSSRRR